MKIYIMYMQCCMFLEHLIGQVSCRPNFNTTWCPDNPKKVGPQACRKQNLWLFCSQPQRMSRSIANIQLNLSSCKCNGESHPFEQTGICPNRNLPNLKKKKRKKNKKERKERGRQSEEDIFFARPMFSVVPYLCSQ